jgi:hypothetical protein
MGEAMRLMSSVGSQHGSGSGRGSKHGHRSTPNGDGATVPGSGSGDPSSFRPDSQFAAVPQLPGAAQSAGASGDEDDGGSGDANGSGSGQNGSGGGSTSPQPGAAGRPLPPPLPPYMHLAHTAVATPSGASQAPGAGAGWQWGMPAAVWAPGQQEQQQQAPPAARGLPPVPQGPPQMAPWVGQDAGLAAVGRGTAHLPSHAPAGTAQRPATATPGPASAANALPRQQQAAGLSAMPMPMGMPMGGPFGAAPGSGGGSMLSMLPSMVGAGSAGNDPLAWWYQNYYGATTAPATYQQQPQVRKGRGCKGGGCSERAAERGVLCVHY